MMKIVGENQNGKDKNIAQIMLRIKAGETLQNSINNKSEEKMGYQTSIIKISEGTYSLVGKVPISLSYVQKNGEPLTETQIKTIQHCGAGIITKQIKSVVFETEESAREALEKYSE